MALKLNSTASAPRRTPIRCENHVKPLIIRPINYRVRGKQPAVLAQRFLEATGYNGLLGKGDDDVMGSESPDWTDGNPRKPINKLLVRGQMRNK